MRTHSSKSALYTLILSMIKVTCTSPLRARYKVQAERDAIWFQLRMPCIWDILVNTCHSCGTTPRWWGDLLSRAWISKLGLYLSLSTHVDFELHVQTRVRKYSTEYQAQQRYCQNIATPFIGAYGRDKTPAAERFMFIIVAAKNQNKRYKFWKIYFWKMQF